MKDNFLDLFYWGCIGILVAIVILSGSRMGELNNCLEEAMELAEESIDTTADLAGETRHTFRSILSGQGFDERGLLEIADRQYEHVDRLEELQETCN